MPAHISQSTLQVLASEGHCIHMTHPAMVRGEIAQWLTENRSGANLIMPAQI